MSKLGDSNTPAEFESVNTDESRTNSRTVAVSVPTDHSTVMLALDAIRDLRPAPGLRFELVVESGHAIQQQIVVDNEDLSHVTISSSDATVPVSSNLAVDEDVMRVVGDAVGPKLAVKIDCQSNGDNGLVIKEKSEASIGRTGDYGVINAATDNLRVSQSSTFSSYGNDFSGAGRNGITVRAGSVGDFGGTPNGPDVSGAGNDGILVELSSTVRANNATVDNCGNDAIVADDSRIAARNLSASNIGRNGIFTTMSQVDIDGATLDGNLNGWGILAVESSMVSANSVTATDLYGFSSRRSSRLTAQNGSTNRAIEVKDGGTVECSDTTTQSSTGGLPHENDLNEPPNTITANGIIFVADTEV